MTAGPFAPILLQLAAIVLAAVVIMVLLTAMMTPVTLKWSLGGRQGSSYETAPDGCG